MMGGQVAYWAAVDVACVSPHTAFCLYAAFALGYVVVQLSPEAHEHRH